MSRGGGVPSANIPASTSSLSTHRREDSVFTSMHHLNPASSLHNPHPHRVSRSYSVSLAVVDYSLMGDRSSYSVRFAVNDSLIGNMSSDSVCFAVVDYSLMGNRSHENQCFNFMKQKNLQGPINTTGTCVQPQ